MKFSLGKLTDQNFIKGEAMATYHEDRGWKSQGGSFLQPLETLTDWQSCSRPPQAACTAPIARPESNSPLSVEIQPQKTSPTFR